MNKYDGMMAISIRQPWAWLIVNGYKIIETRSWCPPDKYRDERIAIHAGQKAAERAVIDYLYEWAAGQGFELPSLKALIRGAVVGSVKLSTVREYPALDPDMFFKDGDLHLCSDSGLFVATDYGWELTDPEIEPHPFKLKGRLGFFPALEVNK